MTLPLLTIAEYRSAPSAVDTTSLVAGGNQAAQDAELARVIARASGWIGNTCNQDLVAQARTVTVRTRVNRCGELVLHPGEWPLVQLTALSYGWAANALSTVSDLTGAYIVDDSYFVPAWGGQPGLSAFQLGGRPGVKLLVRYTHVAGYPCTTLAATANVNATTFTVASSAGIVAGTQLLIVDGSVTETVTVTVVAGTTITISPGLASTHTVVAGVATAIAVHALPEDVKQAAILATSAFVKFKGADAMVLGNAQPGAPQGVDPSRSADLRQAAMMLASYRRML